MRLLPPALGVALLGLTPGIAAAAEAQKEGMPQLDFANPLTIAQVVWGAIIFVMFYFLLSRWALPQVGSVLEERAAGIARDLDAATKAKADADAAVAELTEATRQANATAQAEIAGAVAKAKQEAADKAAVLSAKLEADLSAAEQRIGVARSAAMGALRQVATDTAEAVVTRLTGYVPDSTQVDAAVGHALAARPAT